MPRLIRRCDECPLCAKMPGPGMSGKAYPYCITGRRFLTGVKKAPLDCPMRGKTIAWEG